MIRRINAGNRIHFIPGIGIQVITPRGGAKWWLAETEEQQLAKAEAEKEAAMRLRQAKFAAFKAKAEQRKASATDLTEIILALVEAQLE